MATITVHRPAHHVTACLCSHAHLIVLLPERRRETIALMPRAGRGQEVDDEGPDVEDVDQGDGPFNDGGAVVMFLVAEDAEGDGKGDFDENEGELDPERRGEDTVFAVVDSESLVLGTNENGRDDVSRTARISIVPRSSSRGTRVLT